MHNKIYSTLLAQVHLDGISVPSMKMAITLTCDQALFLPSNFSEGKGEPDRKLPLCKLTSSKSSCTNSLSNGCACYLVFVLLYFMRSLQHSIADTIICCVPKKDRSIRVTRTDEMSVMWCCTQATTWKETEGPKMQFYTQTKPSKPHIYWS